MGEKMTIPLLDLRRGYEEIKDDLRQEWEKIFQSMELFNGPNLKAFEKEFANFLGVSFAFGCASGTDALTLGLIASGIKEGDKVLLHSNAFAAACEAIRIAGGIPVPVEVEENGFGPDLEDAERKVDETTKALIVVHMYGHPVRLDPCLDLCRKYGLLLIEDASHAHGALYRGRRVGSFGHVACFSCGVVKNLNAYGDAGVVVTNDETTAHLLNYLRVHGQVKKNEHHFYGFNSRLDEIHAATLRVKLKRLDEKNERRRRLASLYREGLSDLHDLILPPDDRDTKSVYHHFVIRTRKREGLMEFLRERNVGFGIHYPVPLHLQPSWKKSGYGEFNLPRSERLSKEILSLPVFPELRDEEVEYIIESIRVYFGANA